MRGVRDVLNAAALVAQLQQTDEEDREVALVAICLRGRGLVESDEEMLMTTRGVI